MARQRHLTSIIILGCIIIFSLIYMMSSSGSPLPIRSTSAVPPSDGSQNSDGPGHLADSVLYGESIAPRLENATAK